METYTEEEYQRHSGTHLEEEEDSEDGASDLESESDNEQGGSSIEFQNETFSEEESFGSEASSSLDSDSFHSARDREEGVVFKEEGVVCDSSPSGGWRGSSGLGGEGVTDHSSLDGVFMDGFSDNSDVSEEGRNVLGKLETEVMNMSISRFRRYWYMYTMFAALGSF